MGVESKKKEKRERLLKTGINLFSHKGFSMTTIDDITRQAGVAKGTFYLYFKDKRDFFNEIVQSMALRHEANCKKLMAVASCPMERLKTYIASELSFYRDNADFARFAITAAGSEAEFFVNWYVNIQKKHISFLAEIINQGSKEGAFAVDDVYKAAQFLQGAVFMFVAHQILGDAELSQIDKNTDFIFNTFLKGAQGEGRIPQLQQS